MAATRKKGNEANTLFERAIGSAETYQFINYKALGEELSGRFQYKAGNRIMARTFLNNARRDYMKWGALAKVHFLEERYRDLLGDSILKEQPSSSNPTLSAGMDLNLVLQSNQAIKSTKDVDALLEQLMNLIIKYSGADKGYLILANKSELMVTAKYSTGDGAVSCSEYVDHTTVPLSLIKYVLRAKKRQILNSPAQIPEYSRNRYFMSNHPKSVICFPILKQGEVFGILYLENYQHEDVFSEEKISVLNLMSAQIAVSLDNAFLYENLERRVLERTRNIEEEKGIVDEMLENILPKASIEELKRTGKTTAQKFDGITVLMADIKGFTRISEILSPEELISRIDYYFSSFDEIMTRYQLERIKTIGDAYMAAGGLHGDPEKSALNMVYAAMEMQEFITRANREVPENEQLTMRIGLNTGPVIAGIVGYKRYQYDIWGDTVNVAARMEQQSEPGRINVSNSTHELTKDCIDYHYRGKIEGKNKGLMDMYFVESRQTKDPGTPSVGHGTKS
jgi:class 3 adenylate cyclase